MINITIKNTLYLNVRGFDNIPPNSSSTLAEGLHRLSNLDYSLVTGCTRGPKANTRHRGSPRANTRHKGGPKVNTRRSGGPKMNTRLRGGPRANTRHRRGSQGEHQTQQESLQGERQIQRGGPSANTRHRRCPPEVNATHRRSPPKVNTRRSGDPRTSSRH